MGISEAVVQSVSSTSLGVIFICLSLIWNILSSLSTRTAGKTEQLEAELFFPFFPVQSLQTFADFLALLVFCPPCNILPYHVYLVILPYYIYLGICISMNQEELLVDNELHRSA